MSGRDSFKRWLLKENIEKSLRRKMATVVHAYLGVKPAVRDLGFEDMSGEGDSLFGTPIGYVDRHNPSKVRVPEDHKMSALHEVLHTSGFTQQNISELWSEGITQIVAEDIAKVAHLQIPITYSEYTQYVRTYLLPLVQMDVRQFARGYARATDKSDYLMSLLWSRYSNRFSNTEDWGTNTYQNMKEMFQSQLGTWNPYLEYLITGR